LFALKGAQVVTALAATLWQKRLVRTALRSTGRRIHCKLRDDMTVSARALEPHINRQAGMV